MKQAFSFDELRLALNSSKYFFVVGWYLEGRESVLDQAEFPQLGSGIKLKSVVTYERSDVAEFFKSQGFGGKRRPVGYMARFEASDPESMRALMQIVARADNAVHVRADGVDARVKAVVLDLTTRAGPQLGFLMGNMKRLFEDSELEHNLLEAIELGRLESATQANCHIEGVFRLSRNVMIIRGWIMDLAGAEMFVFNRSDCSISKLNYFGSDREDVSEYLTKQGVSPIGRSHGFLGIVEFADRADQIENYSLAWMSEGRLFFLPLNADMPRSSTLPGMYLKKLAAENPADLNRVLLELLPPSEAHRKSLKDVVERSTVSAMSEAAPAELSVVVPYHSEMFFIDDLMLMIEDGPKAYEWVVVCDDKALVERMRQKLLQHSKLFTTSVKFVVTPGDSGFATACNAGAHFATSERILFMNSDILIQNFDPINRAVQHLKEQPGDVAGFTLLFEDDTIQHAGIYFRAASSFGGLLLAEHKNKGMPAKLALPDNDEQVLAVTGALMLLSRSSEPFFEYFSQDYINGDFEDADICLKVRAEGGRCILFSGEGMYHLERQSIGRASEEKRFMFTLRNSATFSDKWRNYLESIGEVH